MQNIIIKEALTPEELTAVVKIRTEVFVKEQCVPADREIDGLDNVAKHIILFYNDEAAGCARIRILPSKAKIERVAVLKKYRGLHLGKAIMQFVMELCKQERSILSLHSQYNVKDFYAELGFIEEGAIFLDAGIEHIAMQYIVK